MNHSHTIAVLLLAAGTACSSRGAILEWDSNFSGSASNANNWNPHQVPTATDELQFLNGLISGNYTVTFDSLVSHSQRHFYAGDNVTLRITNAAGHTTSSIDIDNGGSAYLEQGLLVVSGVLGVGALSSSGGHLTVDGSTLRLTGAGLVLRSTLGTGSIRVTGGGTLDAPNGDLLLDPNPGFVSTFLADLSSIATLRNVSIGETSVAVATVDASAMNVSGDLRIASNAAGDGQLIVQSSGGVQGSLTVGDDIFVSSNASASSAGAGILQLTGSLTRVTCDQLNVGDVNGGSALVRLSTGAVLTCSSANFLGSGFLDIDTGTFFCNGAFVHAAPLTIDGVSSQLRSFGNLDIQSALIVGNADSGLLAESNGTLGSFQQCTIGNLAGSSGNLTLNHGTQTFHQSITVGNAGRGDFIAASLATVECDGPVSIGLASAGTGTLRSTGAGLVRINAGVGVGGSQTAAGGTGEMRADIGGRVEISGLCRIWGNGTIAADSGGSVTAASTIELRPGGVARVDGGTIVGPAMTLTGASTSSGTGATITGVGTVNAQISGTGFGNVITPTGDLELGLSTSNFGFDATNITINAGAQQLVMRDRNAAVVGNATVAAGTLSAPNGMTVANGRSVSGGGTIDAPAITLLGGINATTPQGFVIKGIASGSGGLTGTLFDFSNSGGFTGAGNINSQIRGTAGSVITATGNLSLGTSSTVGFSFDGTLRTNANQITLHDTSTAFVGNIEMAGGSVICVDTDLTSDINDVTSGFGTIAATGRTWINAGTIRPSGAGTDATGQIGSFGNVNMENVFDTATLDMQIGGTASADIDRFAVVGALTLDGTLRVRFVPGYIPAGGEEYTIVTASSMSGAFTSIDLPPRTFLITTPTSIRIGAMCPADQNADGGVDGDDVIEFFAAWDASDPAADFNSDGGVDGDDVISFFEHWDAGC